VDGEPDTWRLALILLRSGDEEDVDRLGEEIAWLRELAPDGREVLREELTNQGRTVQACDRRRDSERRCHAVKGERFRPW